MPRMRTEIDLLSDSLDQQDAADRNWDHDARVAACSAGLEDGADKATLAKIFGEEVLRACEQSEAIAHSKNALATSPLATKVDASADVITLVKAIEDSADSLKGDIKHFDDALATLFYYLRAPDESIKRRRRYLFDVIERLQDWKKYHSSQSLQRDVTAQQFASLIRKIDRTSSLVMQKVISEASQGLLHPLLVPEGRRLAYTDIIDSLARVQNAVTMYKPDLIIAGNAGGSAISRLLTYRSELTGTPIAFFEGYAEGGIRWNLPIDQFGQPTVIAVVGDLALSGRTVRYILELLRERFPTSKIYCAVLAASPQALKETSSACHLIYHQLTAVGSPQFEYGPITGYEEGADFFLFKTKRAQFPVPLQGLALTRRFLEKQVVNEQIPWLVTPVPSKR